MTPTEENLCDSYARLLRRRIRAHKELSNPGKVTMFRSRSALRKALFIEAFLAGGCTTARGAAIRAGFPEASAAVRGWSLLRDPEVAAAIEKSVNDRLARIRVTTDRVVREAAAIALVDPTTVIGADGRYKPVSEWPEDVRHAVASMEIGNEKKQLSDSGEETTVGRVTSAKFHSKLEAISVLAKLLSMVVDRQEVKAEISGPGGGPLQMHVQVEAARKSLMDKLATLRPLEVAEGEIIS
jgi:phage terminase small subunit